MATAAIETRRPTTRVTIPAESVDHKYLNSLDNFKRLINGDLASKAASEGTALVTAHINNGRVYDSIYVVEGSRNKTRPANDPEVRYFIDKTTGDIYGPRSAVSPNLNHWFGTIYEAQNWDWTDARPTPKDLDAANVVVTGQWGDYLRYERKSPKTEKAAREFAEAKAAKLLPKEPVVRKPRATAAAKPAVPRQPRRQRSVTDIPLAPATAPAHRSSGRHDD